MLRTILIATIIECEAVETFYTYNSYSHGWSILYKNGGMIMNIHETYLPGIGKKYLMDMQNGDKIAIIIHDNGRREIYHFDPKDLDTTISMVTMSDEEARQVAGIIGGMTYHPKALETVDISIEGLVIEWHKIDANAKCIGKQIGEIDVRKNTGATIIAVIEQGSKKQISPGADYVFQPNSTLVLTGERAQIKKLKELLHNGEISST